MRQVYCLLVCCLTLVRVGLCAHFGEVTSMVGNARVYSAKRKSWKPVRMHQKLLVKDQIRTLEESRVEITCTNGGIVRIDEKSEILLTAQQGQTIQKVSIKKGKVWANMRKMVAKRQQFDVYTPTATASIRGTVFRVNANKDTSADVLVYQGKVDVGPSSSLRKKLESEKKTPPGGGGMVGAPTQVAGPKEVSLLTWVNLVAGYQISVQRSGQYKTFKFDQEADSQVEWVEWNQLRDAKLGGPEGDTEEGKDEEGEWEEG